MNQYQSPEEEAKKKKRDENQARYQAQVIIAEALTQLIMSRENEISIAENVRHWVNADKERDGAIRSLDARMKRLEEQGKSIEAIFNIEVRKMRNVLSKHLYDDFDWVTQYNSVANKYYDLYAKFTELEIEHRMLMKQVLKDAED